MSFWMFLPWMALLLLALPVAVLLVQVSLAWLPGSRRRSRDQSSSAGARVAVLVPAHNEAAVITSTLNAILPQLKTGDRIVVVADNCTDDTSALARSTVRIWRGTQTERWPQVRKTGASWACRSVRRASRSK